MVSLVQLDDYNHEQSIFLKEEINQNVRSLFTTADLNHQKMDKKDCLFHYQLVKDGPFNIN